MKFSKDKIEEEFGDYKELERKEGESYCYVLISNLNGDLYLVEFEEGVSYKIVSNYGELKLVLEELDVGDSHDVGEKAMQYWDNNF